MPATSKAQFRFMQAAKHNPKFAQKAGISPDKAAEFVADQADYKKLPERSHPALHRKVARGG